jgi:hypothetical protein
MATDMRGLRGRDERRPAQVAVAQPAGLDRLARGRGQRREVEAQLEAQEGRGAAEALEVVAQAKDRDAAERLVERAEVEDEAASVNGVRHEREARLG